MIFGKPLKDAEKAHTRTLEGGASPMTDGTAFCRSPPAGDFHSQEARVSEPVPASLWREETTSLPPIRTPTGQGDAEGAEG